jgi:hypothetical protein
MKYEKSIANVNKVGEKSIILELKSPYGDFLSAIVEMEIDEETTHPSPIMDVLLILDGQCCEGDYIITTDEDDTHDVDALYNVIINDHGYELKDTNGNEISKEQSILWFKKFLTTFKEFITKREVTWG